MKPLKGFEDAKVIRGENTQLPKGGYIVQIKACEEISRTSKKGNAYTRYDFSFDVAEGEYKDHFANVYKNSKDENKKWRGVHNEFIPQEGSQYYEDNLSKFKTMIVNFEESNPGFHWDWDEKKLVNKYIGIIYREEEFKADDGNIKITTKPYIFLSVDSIRNGKYKVPPVKKLPENTTPATTDFASFLPVSDDDDELPFS